MIGHHEEHPNSIPALIRTRLRSAMMCHVEDLEDFPERPDDDELLLEEFDMLELRPELETGLIVTVDAMLRAGTPEVELWLHQPETAAMNARLTPSEARELASMLERQAADVEGAKPSFERCPACDGRGVVAPGDELFCERCEGDGRIPIPPRGGQ
jgi:hypothetical protein